MQREKVYCLMVEGGILPDVVRNVLFCGAYHMFQTKASRIPVGYFDEEYSMHGVITTQWQYVCLGSISGPVFEAEIEYNYKQIHARYVPAEQEFASMSPAQMSELIRVAEWADSAPDSWSNVSMN